MVRTGKIREFEGVYMRYECPENKEWCHNRQGEVKSKEENYRVRLDIQSTE